MPLKHPLVATREVQALRRSLGATIAAAIADDAVVEIMVNADGQIWTDRLGHGCQPTGDALTADAAETIVRLIANHIGEEVSAAKPLVAGVLPESGERFQGVLPPIARAPVFTIRKRPKLIYSLDDYAAQGMFGCGVGQAPTATPAEGHVARSPLAILREAVTKRQNILIAGGTGSGKTTFANAILREPGFASDRVIVIEDTAELQCSAANRLELLTRRLHPPVTMRDLVQATLRLRPDRIVIGEVRDGAALDLLKAWNTGHPGGIATIHANSALDALYRLEDLIGEATATIPHRAIGSGINLIVFITRTRDGRRIDSISRVLGWSPAGYRLEPVL